MVKRLRVMLLRRTVEFNERRLLRTSNTPALVSHSIRLSPRNRAGILVTAQVTEGDLGRVGWHISVELKALRSPSFRALRYHLQEHGPSEIAMRLAAQILRNPFLMVRVTFIRNCRMFQPLQYAPLIKAQSLRSSRKNRKLVAMSYWKTSRRHNPDHRHAFGCISE